MLAFRYEGGRKLNGIIFMHRISDYRMGGVARKNFRLFRKICGDDALKSVVIVTNMWGDVTEEVGAGREKELKESDLFFKPALEKGTKIVRHNNTAESARRIVQGFLGNAPETLSIQREVVDEKKTVAETNAGLDLQAELDKQMAKHRRELKGIREEMAELMALKDKKHEDEIQELNVALGDVKAQMTKFELAHQRLTEERHMDKQASEEKAKQMAREMEQREAILQALRDQTRAQEAKIDGLQGALADVEQKARDQELQKKVVSEELRNQAATHTAELDRIRKEFEDKLAEAASRNEEKKVERTSQPPRAPWDIIRDFPNRPAPRPRPGGFFKDIAFIVDQLFTGRPHQS